MKVFGVSLVQVLDAQRKSHPECGIPYFLDAAFGHMIRNSLCEQGLFRVASSKVELTALKKQLDSSGGSTVDFAALSPHATCDLIKHFFRDLDSCLLTPKLFDQWIAAVSDDSTQPRDRPAALQRLVAQLPPENRALLQRLVHLLRQVAANSSMNCMTAENLGVVWGPNLLWLKEQQQQQSAVGMDAVALMTLMMDSAKVNKVAECFVKEYPTIFRPVPSSKEFAILDKRTHVSELPVVSLAIISTAVTPPPDSSSSPTSSRPATANSPPPPSTLAARSNKYCVWASDNTGGITAFDSDTGEVVKKFDSGQGVVFKLVTVGREIWSTSKGSVSVWCDNSGKARKTIEGFQFSVCAVGNSVWTGGDSKIQVWDADALECVQEIPQPDNVVTSILYDDNSVWTGGTDGVIRTYDPITGDLLKEIPSNHKKVNDIVAATATTIWTAHDGGALCVWDRKAFKIVSEADGGTELLHVEMVGETVWATTRENTIRVFDAHTAKPIGEIPTYHSEAISQVTPIWNKQRAIWQVWSCSWDGTVCCWDLNAALVKIASPTAPMQTSSHRKGAALSRRPSIMFKPARIEAPKLALVVGPRNVPQRPTRSNRAALKLAKPFDPFSQAEDTESLPDQWKTVAQRRAIDPGTPIEALVTAAVRHTRMERASSKEVLTEYFRKKKMTTCADLVMASDADWEEITKLVGKSMVNALSTVLCFVPSGSSAAPIPQRRNFLNRAAAQEAPPALPPPPASQSPTSALPPLPPSPQNPRNSGGPPARPPPPIPQKPRTRAATVSSELGRS